MKRVYFATNSRRNAKSLHMCLANCIRLLHHMAYSWATNLAHCYYFNMYHYYWKGWYLPSGASSAHAHLPGGRAAVVESRHVCRHGSRLWFTLPSQSSCRQVSLLSAPALPQSLPAGLTHRLTSDYTLSLLSVPFTYWPNHSNTDAWWLKNDLKWIGEF